MLIIWISYRFNETDIDPSLLGTATLPAEFFILQRVEADRMMKVWISVGLPMVQVAHVLQDYQYPPVCRITRSAISDLCKYGRNSVAVWWCLPRNSDIAYLKCSVALRVSVGVESCTVVFLRGNFLFTFSDTFAAGCIVYGHNTQRKPNRRHFRVWKSHGRGHVTIGYSRRCIFGGSAVQCDIPINCAKYSY